MYCGDCAKMIPRLLRGDLDRERTADVQRHLESCRECRTEYEEMKWLYEGVTANRWMIEADHPSARLLYEHAEDPTKLDGATRERVRSHLEECDRCREDLARIQRLQAIPLPGPGMTATVDVRTAGASRAPSPWPTGRRLRFLIAAAATVVLLVIGTYILRDSSTPVFVARIVSTAEGQGQDIVDLPTSFLFRGEPDSPKPVVIPRSGARNVVLRLDLDLLEDDEPATLLRIQNEAGDPVWEGLIEPGAVKEGTLALLLDKTSFTSETYRVVLLDKQSVVSLNAFFRIAE